MRQQENNTKGHNAIRTTENTHDDTTHNHKNRKSTTHTQIGSILPGGKENPPSQRRSVPSTLRTESSTNIEDNSNLIKAKDSNTVFTFLNEPLQQDGSDDNDDPSNNDDDSDKEDEYIQEKVSDNVLRQRGHASPKETREQQEIDGNDNKKNGSQALDDDDEYKYGDNGNGGKVAKLLIETKSKGTEDGQVHDDEDGNQLSGEHNRNYDDDILSTASRSRSGDKMNNISIPIKDLNALYDPDGKNTQIPTDIAFRFGWNKERNDVSTGKETEDNSTSSPSSDNDCIIVHAHKVVIAFGTSKLPEFLKLIHSSGNNNDDDDNNNKNNRKYSHYLFKISQK